MSSRQITTCSGRGVISQKLTFQLYAGLRNSTSKFKPGVYLLNSNMSYDEIIVALQTGNEKQNIRPHHLPRGDDFAGDRQPPGGEGGLQSPGSI